MRIKCSEALVVFIISKFTSILNNPILKIITTRENYIIKTMEALKNVKKQF